MNNKNIMYNYTAEDHRKRLENLKIAERQVKSCLRKEMITDYIPGHFVYPSAEPNTPEKDEQLFQYLSDCGVGIIQLWSKWFKGRWRGQEMYRPILDTETKQFIDMVHRYGMKILPYTATNFFERFDPTFNPDWAYDEKYDLKEYNYSLAHCSATSPSWRAHLLKQFTSLLDDYEFDGLYIDAGYIRRSDFLGADKYYEEEPVRVKDEIHAFRETEDFDGGMQDLMALIYSEVKKRNGILKIHKEGTDTIHTDLKIYDYLWVGEAVKDISFLREKVKGYEPYVVPDFNFGTIDEHERYLNTIPYMQFPILRNGTTGIASPGAAIPDMGTAMNWLSLYKQMTPEGTWCYIDAKIPNMILSSGKETVASLFVNLDFYLVLANYSQQSDFVTLSGKFVEIDPEVGEKEVSDSFQLEGRQMKILKKVS